MTTADVQAIPLFESVPRRHRHEVASRADRVTLPAGKILTRQGELAHEFFVILDGLADVVRDGELVAMLGPGDFFGEVGLVGKPFRTATVVARSELEVAVLERREFHLLIRRFPDLAATILSTGARRVASTLRQVETRGPRPTPVDVGAVAARVRTA